MQKTNASNLKTWRCQNSARLFRGSLRRVCLSQLFLAVKTADISTKICTTLLTKRLRACMLWKCWW